MIPYEIDPSLYTAEPELPVLDDGFSPPHRSQPAPTAEATPADVDQVDPAFGATSPS